ncbi:MAG: Ig-like domain-containing protein [Methylococcales bacterium]
MPPPKADDQSVSTNEDTSLSITLTGSDPDNDNLTYAVASQPAHGTLGLVAHT